MEIYLSKPGGQREGPYNLEQINRDLAAKKYSDSDYWGWYEGLEAWVPLYSIPGIVESPNRARSTPAEAESESEISADVQSFGEQASDSSPRADAVREQKRTALTKSASS